MEKNEQLLTMRPWFCYASFSFTPSHTNVVPLEGTLDSKADALNPA